MADYCKPTFDGIRAFYANLQNSISHKVRATFKDKYVEEPYNQGPLTLQGLAIEHGCEGFSFDKQLAEELRAVVASYGELKGLNISVALLVCDKSLPTLIWMRKLHEPQFDEVITNNICRAIAFDTARARGRLLSDSELLLRKLRR
jgi:hypothetical protein